MIISIESDKFKVISSEGEYTYNFKVKDLETGNYISAHYSELHELIEILKKAEEIF